MQKFEVIFLSNSKSVECDRNDELRLQDQLKFFDAKDHGCIFLGKVMSIIFRVNFGFDFLCFVFYARKNLAAGFDVFILHDDFFVSCKQYYLLLENHVSSRCKKLFPPVISIHSALHKRLKALMLKNLIVQRLHQPVALVQIVKVGQ